MASSTVPASPEPRAEGALPTGFLGLDVSQQEVVACFLLPDGREVVPRWRMANTQPGAQLLAERLLALAQQHGVGRVRIGMEATNLYWWHLACFLEETAVLAPLVREVYALNPKLVHGLKGAYPNRGKTDHLDAFYIAERLRLGRLPAPFQLDVLYAPLQRLTRFRTHLAQTLAREKNYLLSVLFLQFSGFCQTDAFSDHFGVTSCALLEEFTTEEVAQTPVGELARFLDERSRGTFAHPEALAATLQQVARDSYRPNRVLDAPLRVILALAMTTMRTLQKQLAELDKTIARELAALPPFRRTIGTVPGLGPVWTAGLLAEIGAITRFDNDAALARFAGLVWNPTQSGEFQAEETRLAKSGNTYLRYYLVEGANSVRLHCPEYQAYYAAKLAQSAKHAHKRALVLTARKLVRLVDHLLRAGAVYQPPAQRQDRKEGQTPPRAARPRPARRHRLATSASAPEVVPTRPR